MSNYDTEPPMPPRVAQALKRAAQKYETTPQMICSRNRTPHLVEARRFVACELRAAGYSLPRIGRYLGDLHHSTILVLLRGGRVAYDADRVRRRAPRQDKAWEPDYSGEWAI
jgi:Bacterial dnaA protein helix-turn-helix